VAGLIGLELSAAQHAERGRRVTSTNTPATCMRVFSSRCGTIRRSSPALALTRPMAACRIDVSCSYDSNSTLWALSCLPNSQGSPVDCFGVACTAVYLPELSTLYLLRQLSPLHRRRRRRWFQTVRATLKQSRLHQRIPFRRDVFLVVERWWGAPLLHERWMQRAGNKLRCWHSRRLLHRSPV
jgi:hypothetical protein